MSLEDAVDAGLIRAKFHDDVAGQPASETKTYAIGFVVDQVCSFAVVG